MEHNELKPCPYVEKVKIITGKEEFNCKTCPALVCPFPKIKEEREKKMELNAEQIKKALECFHQRILNTNLAEKITETEIMAIVDALALINSQEQRIKELTEENERLKKSNMVLIEDNHILSSESIPMVKADTVRKMQGRLKANAIVIKDHRGKLGVVVHINQIDQIAKEILEESK